MKLTPEQLKRFDDEGYLFFPNYFSPEETQILKDSIPEVFAQRRKENVREKTGDVVRTAFAVHTHHPVFEALIHHPGFVEPMIERGEHVVPRGDELRTVRGDLWRFA